MKQARKKLHLKRGDEVRVITGDARGERGRILSVLVQAERAIVEGVNRRVIYRKKSQKNPKGERIEKFMPLHISNLALQREGGDATVAKKSKPTQAKEKA